MMPVIPIFNINEMWPGDILCRYSTDFTGKIIMRATGGKWSHDGMYLGHGLVGDALLGGSAKSNPLSVWESACVYQGYRVLVLRAKGMTLENGERAAQWWVRNVEGRPYDWRAIAAIGWSALWGRNDTLKFGIEGSFYCTESCADALHDGAGLRPWWPKMCNMTPGTTYKRTVQDGPTFDVIQSALTNFGEKYKINI